MKYKYQLHRPSPIKISKSSACKKSYVFPTLPVPPAPTTKDFPEFPAWPVA